MKQPVAKETLESRIIKIQSICKDYLPQIYHGLAFGDKIDRNVDVFGDLCVNLADVIDKFSRANRDSGSINAAVSQSFMRETIPKFTEVLLRRKTAREHEQQVGQVLLSVSRILAQPFVQEIPEMSELRNLLFLSNQPQTLKFLLPKDLKLPNTYYQQQNIGFSNPGFYIDYGRPTQAITAKEAISFWPDEWEKILGGHLGVGHYVQVFIESDRVWREGKVSSYNSSDHCHVITLDPVAQTEDSAINKSLEKSSEIKLNLSSTRHYWCDVSNKHRLTLAPVQPTTTKPLAMSQADVGLFLRIWWPKYQRYFYGKVVGFNQSTRLHSIVYEDGDLRDYDMESKTYEIIEISEDKDLVRSVVATGTNHSAAAKLVAKWLLQNREELAELPKAGNPNIASFDRKESVGQGTGPPFIRPAASQGFGMSYWHINNVNAYFAEGGSDNMFNRMSDSSIPPPPSKVLLLNLQFVYQLRITITAPYFRDLAWEVKEGVPFSLTRFDDHQFKDLTLNELVDIFCLLRDLMNLTTGNDKTSQSSERQLDELRLTLAIKLLRCSQIQKRYLGLSMIKEVIDTVSPKIGIYTMKRVQYLIATKNGRYAQDPNPNVVKTSAPPPANNPTFPQTTLSVNEILSWLVNNKVIEEIFGTSIHQDLASKSDLILVFMAYRRVMNENHTDAIWQSCRGAHEAVVKVIHQLIVLIVPVLEPGLRMKFYGQISSLPVKEYNESVLLLIKSFTVQALLKMKDETGNDAKSNNSDIGLSTPQHNTKQNTQSNEESLDSGSVFSLNRKGLVISAPPRRWLGFGMLWQFIQDPEIISTDAQKSTTFVDESLFDLAIQLLVELLQSEFTEEREKVMQRCLENVRHGISVPVSLHLFRRTLATYASSVKSWFGGRPSNAKVPTISSQIEKFQKQEKLLDVIFMDIERYNKSLVGQVSHSGTFYENSAPSINPNYLSPKVGNQKSMARNNGIEFSSPLNDARITIKGKISRTSHIKAVTERLDFLKFVLSRSSLSLNDTQMMILWKAFGDGAVTIETFEKLIDWMDSLILRESKSYSILLQSLAQDCDSNNPNLLSKLAFLWNEPGNNSKTSEQNSEEDVPAFEDRVLVRLFEQHMTKWLSQRDKVEYISRQSVATLCMKLFLLVNLSNRALRVETDGIWFRMGPLSGLTVLWRLALDSIDPKISEAAITLIVELHHRTPPKFRGANQIRSYLMRLCFVQLSTAVQSLRSEDVSTPERHERPDLLLLQHQSVTFDKATSGVRDSRKRSKTFGDDRVKTSSSQGSSRLVLDGEGYPVTYQVSHSQPSPNRLTDTPAIAIAPGCDDWYDDGDSLVDASVIATRITRLISLMRLFIHRFQRAPTQIYTIKVLAGREEAIAVTINMLATDTIGALRQKISTHFKEPANMITLTRSTGSSNPTIKNGATPATSIGASIWSSSSIERLDKDDMTLKQAKFHFNDSVIARKKEAVQSPSQGQSNGIIVTPNQLDTSLQPDFISPAELGLNILEVLKPVGWLSAVNTSHTIGITLAPKLSADSEPMYTEPYFPLSRRPESNLWQSENSSFAGNSLVAEGSDGAESTEYLGQYLKKNPHHIDQLLEMLDGYLSAEILKAVPHSFSDTSLHSNSDLSTIIWEVVQSLPVHTELLHEVKDSVNDGSGASIRRLLDTSSRYRFLYVLQIVDSLLDAARSMAVQSTTTKPNDPPLNFNSSNPTHTIQSTAVPKQLAKSSMEWSLKFLFIGGAEHVILLLSQTLTSQLRKINNSSQESRSTTPTKSSFPTSPDATMLTITILIRILHRLLMLDPLFDRWNYNQRASSTFLLDSILGGNHQKVPPGIVLACVDVKSMIHNLLNYTYAIRSLPEREQGSASSIQSLVENTLTLVFGLCFTSEEGHSALVSSSINFNTWLKVFALDTPHSNVRQGCCRRVFEACTNIMSITNDSSVQDQDKMHRLSLMSYIIESVLNCISHGRTDTSVAYNAEQLYSLTAVLIALKFTPALVFPVETVRNRKISSDSASLKYQLSLASGDLGRSISSPSTRAPSPANLPSTIGSSGFNVKELYQLFVQILVEHKSSESFHSNEVDGTLIGALRVLLILATYNSTYDSFGLQETYKSAVHTLIEHLYTKCLFPPDNNLTGQSIQSTLGASCQVWESRNYAYAILHQLCRHSEDNLRIFADIISNHYVLKSLQAPNDNFTSEHALVKSKPKVVHWSYNPNLLAKDSGAFVGLVNQGGTCYMNSFLQQLFHVPAFCDAILKIESNVDKDDESDGDVLLFQLQVLFGYLRLSQKKYFDTLAFCKTIKDYDGQPISLVEQKDINEFAGMLFDKLESNESCKRALGNIIQGKVVYKTKSLESAYRSEREEAFYMITAEVKGKRSLQESLDLLVAEELFSGENKLEDEKAGRKVDAVRRCSIRELPNTLIIHLKRFEFELETMDRKKVNDLITFPMDLDMFPYTEAGISMKEQRLGTNSENDSDGVSPIDSSDSEPQSSPTRYRSQTTIIPAKPDDYYKYKLVGVVAHVGAIDRGHYYSFIKERNGEKWYEFNDKNVFPFSPEAIPNECFGGEDTSVSQPRQPPRMKQNNAYLLVYERHNSFTTSSNDPDTYLDNPSELSVDHGSKSSWHSTDMSKKVLQAVWSENTEFQTDRYVFSSTHFRFLWQLLNSPSLNAMVAAASIRDGKNVPVVAVLADRFDEGYTRAFSTASSPVASVSAVQISSPVSLSSPMVTPPRLGSASNQRFFESASSDVSIPSQPVASPTLSLMTLLGLKFCLEIVSCARATSVLPQFFDKLFDIIATDSTGDCATSILVELSLNGSEPTLAQKYIDPRQVLAEKRRQGSMSRVQSVDSKKLSDLEELEELCHPWLILIFVRCPIALTVKAFTKLILVCIKKVRETQCHLYLRSKTRDPIISLPGVGIQHADDQAVAASLANANSRQEEIASYLSPITILVNKCLSICERMPFEEVIGREGFHMLTGLIYHIALLGYEERVMLLRLQAVYRCVCTVMALNAAYAGRLPREQLEYAVQIIALLVRTTAIGRQAGEAPSSSPLEIVRTSPSLDPLAALILRDTNALEVLEPIDIQAFLNRVFLDEAISIHCASVTQALAHVCACRGPKELIRICEFLNERIEECVLSSRGATYASYRPYVKVLTELLLLSGDQLVPTFDAVVPSIIQRAEVSASRHGTTDSEYLYSVFKLLYRVGTAHKDGYSAVQKYREQWRRLRAKFSQVRRVGPPTITANPAADSPQHSESSEAAAKYRLDL